MLETLIKGSISSLLKVGHLDIRFRLASALPLFSTLQLSPSRASDSQGRVEITA